MIRQLIVFTTVILGLTGCVANKAAVLSLQQIYPPKRPEKVTYKKIYKDKIMKAIFPDAEIKPYKHKTKGEYLVIGEKWALYSTDWETDTEVIILEKYVSINSIMKHQVFPNTENQVIVTLSIHTPYASRTNQFHAAVVVLVQDKDDYRVHSEYYTWGKTLAPSISIDLNNDGLMEIVLFRGIWWESRGGGKRFHLLQAKGDSLVNILDTEVIGKDFHGTTTPEGEHVLEDYRAIVEMNKDITAGYYPIIKTGMQTRYPFFNRHLEEERPLQSVRVIRETFKWNGKKYVSEDPQVLLEYKTHQEK